MVARLDREGMIDLLKGLLVADNSTYYIVSKITAV
jgi:hypothetical protein